MPPLHLAKSKVIKFNGPKGGLREMLGKVIYFVFYEPESAGLWKGQAKYNKAR